ncbi:MAG: hypothetical protein JWQ74_35 [Marmoricola sp.]|nr:hypothetical protein [Marmoricola sp.]
MGVRLVVPRGDGSQVSARSTFTRVRITSTAPHHARSTAAAVTAVLVAALLAGCGQDLAEDPPDPVPTAASTSTSGPVPDGSTTASAAPTATPTPRATEPSEGDGDGEGDDQPATAGGGICADLGADAVGAVLGVAVNGSALAGGGCAYDPKDPQSPAATVVDTPYRPKPGMTGAKNDATSSVEGEPEDLPSLGDAAFVVTGTAFGGEDLQGAGAVRLGDRLISVSVAQSDGLGRAKVRALVVGLLRLAASKSG